MAWPQWHAIPTAMVSGVALVLNPPQTVKDRNSFILCMIWILGFFMDLDHLSLRRIKKILRKDKGPVKGWVNYMHTGWALAAVLLFSFLLGNWLPFISYALHIIIDGGDREIEKYSWVAPLPGFLHRFYPEWLTYENKRTI